MRRFAFIDSLAQQSGRTEGGFLSADQAPSRKRR
jgi:hypothetical protein